MKVAFWGKGKNSLNKAVGEILTAENAQKIADAALEAKCIRWAEMVVDHALYTIKVLSEDGRYYARYNMYTTGKIASEITPDSMTGLMRQKVAEIVLERLKSLGYKAFIDFMGWNERIIEISWERKESK